MFMAVSLYLIGSSWCDTHTSIHQMLGTLLHVIHGFCHCDHVLRQFIFPKSKSSFRPSSTAACSPEAFVPTLLVVAHPFRACIAAKKSTTSVSSSSNLLCTGISNFELLFLATIQSSFNPE